AVDYSYGTSAADIMKAVSQVASNVGDGTGLDSIAARTAIAGNNGVASSQTVNANINALNATIGGLSGLNTALGNLTNGGTTTPATVVTALNNIDATLGKIHGLYKDGAVNSTTVASTVNGNSNLASGTTVEDHLVSLDNSIGDRTLTSSNAAINTAMSGTSVAAGLQAAGNAIGDVDFSSTHYVAGTTNLSDAVRVLDHNMERIDDDLKDLHHQHRTGMASMAAMSALVPNARSNGNTSISLGTGAYQGHTAVALGGFHYLTDNLLLNAGAAWGNTDDVVYRVGLTYSF
ncbi:MAG: YadA C-terminal domain-containing protein, partial [Alphaproteobacteria bacterium]|nr:YadA C-terminal domain-containing protein [Alphaproteobacteria bacterium]